MKCADARAEPSEDALGQSELASNGLRRFDFSKRDALQRLGLL
ncbi:MAG: hypothetical protein OXH32_11860 [Acidobacteria bacterium]|nr:hypothetical protein [Acidobacteriota bacterium]